MTTAHFEHTLTRLRDLDDDAFVLEVADALCRAGCERFHGSGCTRCIDRVDDQLALLRNIIRGLAPTPAPAPAEVVRPTEGAPANG